MGDKEITELFLKHRKEAGLSLRPPALGDIIFVPDPPRGPLLHYYTGLTWVPVEKYSEVTCPYCSKSFKLVVVR